MAQFCNTGSNRNSAVVCFNFTAFIVLKIKGIKSNVFALLNVEYGILFKFVHHFRNGTLKYIGEMHVPWISNYLDFIAFLSVLVVMVFIASGAKISITVNR